MRRLLANHLRRSLRTGIRARNHQRRPADRERWSRARNHRQPAKPETPILWLRCVIRKTDAVIMRALELTGQRFGRLVAIGRSGKYRGAYKWFCRCDCGRLMETLGSRLKSGHTQSCGCFHTEIARQIGKKYRYLITPGDNQHTRRARNQSFPETRRSSSSDQDHRLP